MALLYTSFLGRGGAGGGATTHPLDGLTATGAWSVSRDLYTSFIGSTRYTTATGIDSLKDQSGNTRNLDNGTSTQQPLPTTAGPNSRACADFDGSTDSLFGAAISNFIANNAGYMVASVIADTIASAAVGAGFYIGGDAILNDTVSSGYMGLLFGASGRCVGYNYDGTQDYANGAASAVSAGTAYVVEWRHEGGTMYVRVNGGTEVTVATGNTQVMTGLLRMGEGWDGKIFEAAVFSGANIPNSTARDALVADMRTWIGA